MTDRVLRHNKSSIVAGVRALESKVKSVSYGVYVCIAIVAQTHKYLYSSICLSIYR